MGWLTVSIKAPHGAVVEGEAVYVDPTQEWLDGLVYAVANRIKYPCPTNMHDTAPMTVIEVDVRNEEDPYQVFGHVPIMHRVVRVRYRYEPFP